MKRLLSISLILAAILLLFGMAGCGGSDSGEAALSKKEFVKKAKDICIKAEDEQYKQGFTYVQEHPNVKQEDVVVPAALPPIEKELAKLKDLPAPEQDQSQLTAFYEALEKAITDTKADPGSAMVEKGNPFNKANKLAEAYGLEGCAGNP